MAISKSSFTNVENALKMGDLAEEVGAAVSLKKPDRPLPDYIEEVSERTPIRIGVPLPMGTHQDGRGVNFAFFSRHASRVRLELFDHPTDGVPVKVIDLDPARNRTGDVWHVWVEGIRPGQLYAYRVDGPYQPREGHRFNFNKLLLDPFATAISPFPDWDFGPALGYEASAPEQDLVRSKVDNSGAMPKCVFTHEHFDWHGDRPLRHPWSKTVIYETHVRGFTIHPSSGVEHPGTYRGLTERLPYLIELGVTAVELMPVYEFNERTIPGINPQTSKPLTNYWGYDPVAFFAPKASYSSAGGLGQQKLEFKEMVRTLHRAGIEVILDHCCPRRDGPVARPYENTRLGGTPVGYLGGGLRIKVAQPVQVYQSQGELLGGRNQGWSAHGIINPLLQFAVGK